MITEYETLFALLQKMDELSLIIAQECDKIVSAIESSQMLAEAA